MWKYVGNRLRDTADRTCINIQNLRSSFSTSSISSIKATGSEDKSHPNYITKDGRVFNRWSLLEPQNQQELTKNQSFDVPLTIRRCYEKQKHKQHEAFNGWVQLNVIKWMVSDDFSSFSRCLFY